MTTKSRIIDLRKKSPSKAKKIIRRILFRRDPETKELVRRTFKQQIQFLLPNSKEPVKRSYERRFEDSKCPYCSSRLISTEMGVVCTGENLRYVAMNIENTIKKYGKEKAELFMSNKALRFLDYYMLEGINMTCTYVLGNEERRWRVNNRILSPGIDRKKMVKRK